MERDTKKMRAHKPYVFANLRAGTGLGESADFIIRAGGL
jgi:urease accessory protein